MAAVSVLLALFSLLIPTAVPEALVAKYVIVGAGTTGLLLANRLSSDPNNTVIVIDPSPNDRSNPNVTNPVIWLQNINTTIDWAYPSVPQANADNRTFQYHAGRIVGGTSMINGMTYLRPDKAEIDAWEALGAKGWKWDSLFPYYKAIEQFTIPSAAQAQAGANYVPDLHGESGEVSTGYLFELLNGSFYETVEATWNGLGFSTSKDQNGGNLTGFGAWPMTLDRDAGVRDSAARALYYPIDTRPNLKIVRGTVTKILWGEACDAGQVAKGVEYLDEKNTTQSVDVGPSGEAFLAAGSLRTPLVLEASGIGDRDRLKKLGVEGKIDLPGVGENLQDQQNIALAYNISANLTGYTPYVAYAIAQQLFGDQTQSLAASTNASLSAWAKQIASTGSGAPADTIERILRIQHDLIFKYKVSVAEFLISGSMSRLVTASIPSLPFSRGSVHLRSTDVKDLNSPVVDPHYFDIDFDLLWAIRVGQLSQKFFASKPVKDLVLGPSPMIAQLLPLNATDAQWSTFIKATGNPNYHPLGTAAMMAREMGGVLDQDLKVYGTSNVRVVDASALPLQNSGHLTATLYAVASRAADIILGKPLLTH